MGRLRDQLLACATLAMDVNRRVGFRDARYCLQHPLHFIAFGDDAGEIILLFQQPSQPLVLSGKLATLQRAGDL